MKISELTEIKKQHLAWRLDHKTSCGLLTACEIAKGRHGDIDLRTSELVALEWGDIDFVRGYARINKAKTFAARQAETTKTKTGIRDVKLLPPALEALQRQKAYSFLQGKQIFLMRGSPYKGHPQIREQWLRALKKAGIRYRNPYQTRHTFASFMLSAGENINWLAKQMGHNDITTTLKHYARFIADEDDRYGLKAVEMFGV